MKFVLQRVQYMPKELETGVLYVSDEFQIAIHLCACGCGEKIKTPLGPTEWSVRETEGKPSLRPSVGNWQEGCKSHYWIDSGKVVWSRQWTPEQIEAGRRHEHERRLAYYEALDKAHSTWLRRFLHWLTAPFRK